MDERALRIGAALVLTSPFVPMLFQGEEWGATAPFAYFTDHQDPVLAEAVRAGRREEFAAFGWAPEDVLDPQAPATFAASTLDWDERSREPHASLLDWHRRLVALRASRPEDLVYGPTAVAFDEAERWLAVERGAVTVLVNLDDAPHEVPLAHDRSATVLLSSDPVDEVRGPLPPKSVTIVGVA